jgi:hypothetical protein
MYEKRFVLFLDILGFQKIIEETEIKGEPQKDKINEVISIIEDMTSIVSKMTKKTSKIVTQFSDSIVVSFQENDISELNMFLKTTHELAVKLASKNIFCRGAISYGNIYHNNNVVFGPALVEAYLTESQAAIYPRIILDKSVVETMKFNYTYNKFNEYLSVRFDGKIESIFKVDLDDRLYFDYISKAGYYFEDEKLFEYYKTIRQNIVNGLKYKSPSVKAKYSWLKNKYNQLPFDLNKINEEEDLYYKRPDISKFVKEFKPL